MSKKVKMLQTAKGSPNGYSVITFEKGQEYTIDDSLATVFINQMKVATEVFASFKEEKMISEAPFNKAVAFTKEETTVSRPKWSRKRNGNNS